MLNAPINRVRIVLREFYFIFSLSLFSFDQTHASISLESAGEEEGGGKNRVEFAWASIASQRT